LSDEYGQNSSTSRRDRVLVPGMLLSILVGGATAWGIRSLSGRQPSAIVESPDCPRSISRESRKSGDGNLYILIDLPSNTFEDAKVISKQLINPIMDSLGEGSKRVEIKFDPGIGIAISGNNCLDGTGFFSIKHGNETNQAKAKERFSKALQVVIESTVMSQSVGSTGGPIRLLTGAINDADSASGSSELILWSDLVANDGSCFDASGETADLLTASAVAERCRETLNLSGKFSRLTFVGAGSSQRSSDLSAWALQLKDDVCSLKECK
jgi:hypothetical protein